MARKLKTYVTTSGFFDLAVAAPSMKAALDIWGSRSNLFQNGLARETDDPDIVSATLEHPGLVLRRPVGTNAAFSENAALPKLSTLERTAVKTRKPEPLPTRKKPAERKPSRKPDEADGRKAAQLYDLAQKRREREEQRAEAERKKERERREQATGKAQAALDAARERHEVRLAELEEQRQVIERKVRLERDRWQDEKEKLDAALKRVRE
jgi:colicin import membrane protein